MPLETGFPKSQVFSWPWLRAPAGHAALSGRRAVRTGIVEFAGGDAGEGIRDVRGGCGDLSEQHRRERPHGRDFPVVSAIRARQPLSDVSLRATAAESACTCGERSDHVGHDSMGRVGGPAPRGQQSLKFTLLLR